MNKLFSKAANELIESIMAEMLECEPMIPITVEAAITAGTKLRGAEYIYEWFADITDQLALLAAQERDRRTDSIMQKFMP